MGTGNWEEHFPLLTCVLWQGIWRQQGPEHTYATATVYHTVLMFKWSVLDFGTEHIPNPHLLLPSLPILSQCWGLIQFAFSFSFSFFFKACYAKRSTTELKHHQKYSEKVKLETRVKTLTARTMISIEKTGCHKAQGQSVSQSIDSSLTLAMVMAVTQVWIFVKTSSLSLQRYRFFCVSMITRPIDLWKLSGTTLDGSHRWSMG